MNRADRRRKGREVNNNPKVVTTNNLRSLFSKLNSQDFLMIERVIENRVSNVLEESSYILDMIYSAKLSDLGFSWKETEKFNNDISKTFAEDSEKLKKIQRELGKDCEEKMAKMSVEVENRIKELINAGGGRKEIIETILFEFPKLTKSMATNAYSRTNAELKKGQIKQESVEDPDVQEAMEKVSDILGEGEENEMNDADKVLEEGEKLEKEVEKEVEKEIKAAEIAPVVVTKATVTEVNLEQQVSCSKLKVLFMTLKGKNGTYRACQNGVELTEMGSIICFENIGQVDEWANEVKQVFEMLKA